MRGPDYHFSRDGNEGTGAASQFYYDVKITNNIFSEAKTNSKYYNFLVNSDAWNWGANVGTTRNLWWDFTLSLIHI